GEVHRVPGCSMFLGRRVRTVGRLYAVVDPDRYTALELDLAAADDLHTLVESLQDRDLIATSGTGGHEGLLHHQRVRRQLRPLAGLRRGLLLFGRVVGRGGRRQPAVGLALRYDHEHRLAVRVVDHCGLRQRQVALLRADVDADIGEHAGCQHAIRVGYS